MNLKAHSFLDHFFYASPPCVPTVYCICPDYAPSVPRKFNFVPQDNLCPRTIASRVPTMSQLVCLARWANLNC